MRCPWNVALLALLMLAFCGAAPKPEPDDAVADGARLYRNHCVACHGADGTGDGPRSALLPIAPPDLTGLARRNGGTYPSRKVHRIVDGRGYPRDRAAGMPVWGEAFFDADEAHSEAKVRERITRLVRYVATLQE
jgi:mono/diheme cytochrome c family protein